MFCNILYSCPFHPTAMKLFNYKINPIITYKLHIFKEHLIEKKTETIEKVTAAYLKKAVRIMSVHRTQTLHKTRPSGFAVAMEKKFCQ